MADTDRPNLHKSTWERKDGDTLRLLGVQTRRSKAETEALRKEKALKQAKKVEAEVEKEAIRSAGVAVISKLEDAIAREDDKARDTFPRHHKRKSVLVILGSPVYMALRNFEVEKAYPAHPWSWTSHWRWFRHWR